MTSLCSSKFSKPAVCSILIQSTEHICEQRLASTGGSQRPSRSGIAAALLLLTFFTTNSLHAQGPGGSGGPPSGGGGGGGGGASAITGITVGQYVLRSSYQVSAYEYNDTYTVIATNTNATPYSFVLGTVTSSDAHSVVVSGAVEFGSLPALGTASGLTTFTVRQDHRYTPEASSASWTFVGSASASTVGTTKSGVALNGSSTVIDYGAPIDLTATVTPAAATGTVTFYDGPTPLGTAAVASGAAAVASGAAAVASGAAALSSYTLPTGIHSISAICGGDTTYAASYSSHNLIGVFPNAATVTCALGSETERVTCLAMAFEATLTASQLSTLQLSYTLANVERWSNLPISLVPRNGLAFGSLTSVQLAAALELAKAATSVKGYQRLQDIRGADNVLNQNNTTMGFGTGNYYVAFYGSPSNSTPWQLQLAGHHFAFNHTYNGKYISGTPYFIGTEPSIYNVAGDLYSSLEGPLAGELGLSSNTSNLSLLGYADDLFSNIFGTFGQNVVGPRTAAYALTQSVSGNSAALLSGTFDDVVEGVNSQTGIDTNYPQTYPSGTAGRGVLYTALTSAQQSQVRDMIEAWVDDSDKFTASSLLAAYEDPSALAQTYVGYAGDGTLTSQGDYIRVDGPRVWIEFVVQNGIVFTSSYHYHTIWRDKVADYGGDFLN